MREAVDGEKIIDFAKWDIRRDILFPQAYINPIIKISKGDNRGGRFSAYKHEILRLLTEKKGYYSVILGESGIGKTTTLVDCYRDFADHVNINNYLPIFIKLKLFESSDGKKIIDNLSTMSPQYPQKNNFYWWRIILFLYTDGKAFLEEDQITIKYEYNFKPILFETELNNFIPILFLDALDEIDNISGIILNNLDGLNYVMSMRTDFFDRLVSDNFSDKSDFTLIIQEWTKNEVTDFVERFLQVNTKRKHFTEEEADYIKDIFTKITLENSILKKPLFIMMFIFIIYSREKSPDINKSEITTILKNISLLYKEFLSYWFNKERQRKNSNFPKTLDIFYDKILYDKILIYIAWCLFYQKYQKERIPIEVVLPLRKTSDFSKSHFPIKNESRPYLGDNVSVEEVSAASSNEVRSILQISSTDGKETITKFLHESIGEYLVAFSFVCELKKTEFDEMILSNYYPSEITYFINELMSVENESNIKNIILNLSKVIECYMILENPSETDTRTTNWALYFLSRLMFSLNYKEDPFVIFRNLIESKNNPHPWLKRTAYISLILLGDTIYEEKYLKLIQQDEIARRFNIGDMLRYYGDIKFDASIHPDNVLLQQHEMDTAWKKTYDKLKEALSSVNEKDQRLKKFRVQTFRDMLQWLTKSPGDKVGKNDIENFISFFDN